MKEINEKELNPVSGLLMLIIIILGFIASILFLIWIIIAGSGAAYVIGLILGCLGLTVFSFLCAGLRIVNPREAMVLTLFGKYYGTVKNDGFFFVNPFATESNPTVITLGEEAVGEANLKGKPTVKSSKKTGSRKVSTKTITLNNSQQKVNDVNGNPIIIGTVVIWRVINPTKAVFNVDNYFSYLSTQCDSTIRNIARLYPYDTMDNGDDELTLRGSSLEIAERMKTELQEKADEAGIEIQEVRITHLAYSEEIAAAMLRRQQAAATVAAKEKIVEGAVGMVKMALDQLEEDDIILLDDERKAAMVSNLLVVLCSDKDAQPVVNSGSLY